MSKAARGSRAHFPQREVQPLHACNSGGNYDLCVTVAIDFVL
jgi:hypothetical protein